MLTDLLDNVSDLATAAWTALVDAAEWVVEAVSLALSVLVLAAIVAQIGPIVLVWLAGAPFWAVVMLLFGL